MVIAITVAPKAVPLEARLEELDAEKREVLVLAQHSLMRRPAL